MFLIHTLNRSIFNETYNGDVAIMLFRHKECDCHPFIVHQIYLNIGYCSVNAVFLDDTPILPLADFAKCSK